LVLKYSTFVIDIYIKQTDIDSLAASLAVSYLHKNYVFTVQLLMNCTYMIFVCCLAVLTVDKYRSCCSTAVSHGIPRESEDCPFCWWLWLTRV